jgi:hypothetical protein
MPQAWLRFVRRHLMQLHQLECVVLTHDVGE